MVSRARLWTCERNKVLFLSHMFSGPLHFAVLLFAHFVLFDFVLGALVLTLFPRHSTWLCEVVDVHRWTDVLFSLFVHGLLHHISPSVDCCLLFCCLHIVFGGFLHSNAQCLNEGTFLHSNASIWLQETILCCSPGVEQTLQSWRSAISLIGFLHSKAQRFNERTFLHSNAIVWLMETILCCFRGVEETLQSWRSAISLIQTLSVWRDVGAGAGNLVLPVLLKCLGFQ